jgi:hypothetical protein
MEDYRRLATILRTVDRQQYAENYLDPRHETDLSQRSREIRTIRSIRKVDRTRAVTPYVEFFVNGAAEPVTYIADTGADENIISLKEARARLGVDYRLVCSQRPLELNAVWGECQRALGAVDLRMELRYNRGDMPVSKSKTVRFWVFQSDDTPTLVGIPGMQALGFGIVPKDDVMRVCIDDESGFVLKHLSDPGGGAGCAFRMTTTEEVPLYATSDVVLRPGRSIVRVAVGNGDKIEGRILMSMSHMLGLDVHGSGYIVENNTSEVVDGWELHTTYYACDK